MSSVLTKSERAEYQELKHRLRTWVDDAFQRSQDLRRIRDEKLFLADNYDSFAEFCREELGYTSQWANQIIRSADVTARISETMVSEPAPKNERVARELAKAPPEIQAEVWAEAVEEHGEKVTAAKVAEVVEKRKEAARPTPKAGDSPRNKNGSERITAASRKAALAALGGLVRSLDQMGIVDRCRSMLASIESEIQDAV